MQAKDLTLYALDLWGWVEKPDIEADKCVYIELGMLTLKQKVNYITEF